jgi:hypothetical protein
VYLFRYKKEPLANRIKKKQTKAFLTVGLKAVFFLLKIRVLLFQLFIFFGLLLEKNKQLQSVGFSVHL